MKKLMQIQLLVCFLILRSLSGVWAQDQNQDKTLYPYFKIVSETGTESLPLKATEADVNIIGVIADVTIKQVYQNTGDVPIEAMYVFPASTRAAVYNMEMKIGDRVIKALVKEKNQAREEYAQAKKEGKRTSLLEQDRPNIFNMHVANIIPGDRIEISLKYTETIIPENGVYSFVYPTVVGPRFTQERAPALDRDDKNFEGVPYTKSGNLPSYDFKLEASINSGMTIQDIKCGTHKTLIAYQGLDKATIKLDPTELKAGDRDFILEYQLAGNEIESGLMLFEGEEEQHFMLTLQPPKKVEDSDIPQREYIFVVDVSGSMRGFPIEVTKTLFRNLMSNLRYDDMFNVLLFASDSEVLYPESQYATPEAIEEAINLLDSNNGGGGTLLLSALEETVKLPKCEQGLSRSVVIVTDGYVTVEREVYDLIRKHSNEFNFYSFGIGSSINRYIIEGIAHVGNGEPLFITKSEEANFAAEKFRKYIAAPVLTNINIDWGGMDVYDLEPSNFSDVLAERPVVVSGKYRGKPTGNIQLTGTSGQQAYRAVYNTAHAKPEKGNKALAYLWARKRIQMLDDYIKLDKNSFQVDEVTQLGLKYNLLTAYTSFIAIDDIAALSNDSNTKKVKQPLPLPKGVSNSAVGNTQSYATVQTTQQNNYGVGAELSITNATTGVEMPSVVMHDPKAGVLNKKIIQLQLKNKIQNLKSMYPYLKLTGLEFIIELDDDGNVEKVVALSNRLDIELMDDLLRNIKGWNFSLPKTDKTEFSFKMI